MEIVLEKAGPEGREPLFRLLQYSLYEESLFDHNQMGEDGLFAYPWFDLYFTEADREAYFIKEKQTGRLLGFAMVNTYMQKAACGHSIAEFLVLPSFRRQKVGWRAAAQCFAKHRGSWEVAPSCGSRQAYLFWERVITGYTGGRCRFAEGLFSFTV